MQGNTVLFAILFGTIFSVLGASLSKALRYKAPDECKWITVNDNEDDVSLVCHLRTINSELENTNFSVIQAQHTIKLKLECNDGLFYQSSLNTDSFHSLVELQELVIEYCKIGNLSNNAFNGLKELRNLTLKTHNTDWSTMTLNISPDTFNSDLNKLVRLDLGSNNIWNVPDGSLCSLINLEVLNLTCNRINSLGNFHFNRPSKCLQSLQELDLSNNSIESVPSLSFSGLSRLVHLNLCNNNVNFISDHAFDGLLSLRVIRLNNNILINLPPELFNDLKNLREIHLRNNSLNVLPPGLFAELTQLLVLDLSGNDLTSQWININTFNGLLRLIVLDLSGNKIQKLEASVFRDLYSLQILKLHDNLIENIPDNLFASLYNLHTLILKDNKLTHVDSKTFTGLHVLSLLSLDNNRINYIHKQALKNVSSLQDLHLNGNKLDSVPEALRTISMLKTLDLGENLINDLKFDAFENHAELIGLRLTENHLTHLNKGIFDKLLNLKILNLSRNKIVFIEREIFEKNEHLQAIRLDGNLLNDISGLFNNLSNLVWLNISDNKLKYFDYSMIPVNLQWLDIHDNEISELGNYLEIDNELQLTTFIASHNRLYEITGNSIPINIEILYLNDNNISKIQSYTFFKKPNLTLVDLKNNHIKSLEPYSLRISYIPLDKSMPEFYISNNEFICDCNMEWLKNYYTKQDNHSRIQPVIRDIHAINCKLLHDRGNVDLTLINVKPSQFLCKYQTHCFQLCHCCEFDACDCEMTCPDNCTCYHDQSWKSNVVDCSHGNHRKLPDLIPMDSTELYLDGNDFDVISSHVFIGRKKLQKLYLNSSNIHLIQNRSFNGLINLEDLHLNDNGIRELKGHEFEGLTSLVNLYLHDNEISLIHNESFQSLTRLKLLTLSNNRLVNQYSWILHRQLHVRLAGNPWSCDCHFVQAFRDFVVDFSVVDDASSLKCVHNYSEFETSDSRDLLFQAANDQFGYNILSNNQSCLTVDQANDNSERTLTKIHKQLLQDYLPLLIGSLTCLLVIFVIILLVFIYRQELRVFFHSRFGVRIFSRNHDYDNDSDKLFDAFISYSSKDENFVIEELAPVLESGNPAYKLCLHYRDFPAGNFLPETIIQAVESSKRTIIVLSDNFIKSEWCRFEFKSAHHQILRDRRRRLILILIGHLHQRDLDPDIRLYLKTNTYLQWGDKLFWEKLKFALPDIPNNQRNSLRHQRQYPLPLRRQHNRTNNSNSVHI